MELTPGIWRYGIGPMCSVGKNVHYSTNWWRTLLSEIKSLKLMFVTSGSNPESIFIVNVISYNRFVTSRGVGKIKKANCVIRSTQNYLLRIWFFKWAIPDLFFVYFWCFQKNLTIFTTTLCEKMSTQYSMVLGFEHTTYWTRANVSHQSDYNKPFKGRPVANLINILQS